MYIAEALTEKSSINVHESQSFDLQDQQSKSYTHNPKYIFTFSMQGKRIGARRQK